MSTYTSKQRLAKSSANGVADEYISSSIVAEPALAELKTPDGTFLIQERRSIPRDPSAPPVQTVPKSYAGSPQMMALGGLIIIGVLIASYTAKYDLAIGHANGKLPVPAVGFVALQLFLARAALRLFDDVRSFKTLSDFIVSRLLRYLPAVVPSVLLGFVLINTARIPGMHADLASLPANLFLVADLIGVSDIDSSHWRLKIEIIQAVLVAAAWFGPARRHIAILLSLALVVTAFSVKGEPLRHNVLTLHGLMTNDGYLPLLVFGVALFQLTQDRSSRVWQAMLCAAAALAFLSNSPAHGAVVVAALMVLASIATGGLQTLGRVRWLAHLGEIAFPIYVAHYVLGFAIIHHLEMLGCPAPVAITVAAGAAICAGKALNTYFERPIQVRGPAAIKKIFAVANRIAGRNTTLPQAVNA